MRQGLRTSARLENQLRLDPRVLVTSQLMQLASTELEQAIDAELAENPALERLDDSPDWQDSDSLWRSIAPSQLQPDSSDREFHRSVPTEDASDWTDFAEAATSVTDHLVAQILSSLPQSLHELGCYLCEALDDRGFLTVPDEEIALATNQSLEDVERAKLALKRCEPRGVGASDVRECLLLQLQVPETLEQALARRMLKSGFDDFLNRRTLRLSRRYGVMPEVVEAAYDEIRSLNPFPLEGYHQAGPVRNVRSTQVTAELVIQRTEAGWSVQVMGPEPLDFRVNPAYQRRDRELAGRIRPDLRDERRHLRTYVDRAQTFIGALGQRRETLRKMGQYLVERQIGFISTGRHEFLRPLTRAEISTAIGVHESTISRATNGKFLQIATGEVVSFEVFFKPALKVQKMIEEILATENPERPLSDERITEILAQKGVEVARRTVNKYRDRTRLLSSHRRRMA